jgi:phosphatidylinositol-3,4,5-trisphosphate 3-phosphatase and dual-specificity protein phosphatase PTEN
MKEQRVKPSDLPPSTVDNQDSITTSVTTIDPVPLAAADPVPLAASTDSTPAKDVAGHELPASMFSTSGLSSWARNLKIP